MVAVIFHGETLRDKRQYRIDVLSKYFDPDEDMSKDFHSGYNDEGSVFPFKPTCAFHNKKIHCF